MSCPANVATRREEIGLVLGESAGIAPSSVLGRDVEGAVHATASFLGVSPEQLMERLVARDPASVAALLEAVLVHESHFFRHPEQFEALKEAVFARAKREVPLSLWSAGCAAGEEAYSLAMALVEVGREGCFDRIVGTDVSRRTIAAARRAVYGEWSLRQLGPERRARFFSAFSADLATVAPAIRERVDFRVHELVRNPVPAERFDVVLCRNVLVYLSEDAVERVTRKFLDVLVPGGVLVLSPAELGFARSLPLEREEVGAAVLLRKPASPRPVSRGRAAAPVRRVREVVRRAPATPPEARPALALVPPPAGTAPSSPPATFEEALEAARRGDLRKAERLARAVADREQRADAWLLLAAAADARGDLHAAAKAVKHALYLDPGFAQAHAALVGIFRRLGNADGARRARRNALALLEGLDDLVSLPGVEEITVGALRVALQEVKE